MTDEKIKELIKYLDEKMQDRTLLISDLETNLSDKVKDVESVFYKKVLSDFIEKLDTEQNGTVKNTAKNKKLLKSIDKIFADFNLRQTEKIIRVLLDNVQSVVTFNKEFYKPLVANTPVTAIDVKVKENLKQWLGIDAKGGVIKGTYLDALIKNPTALSQVKNFAYAAITGKRDFQKLKKEFATLIQGDKQNLGLFQKYYRNFVYDSISQIDRATGQIYANDLKFNHAIYEGGLIETSRPFCKQRNGKVFAFSEIKNFNPPTAKQPNYDPFKDMGGFSCRHHLNYIPYVVAKALRPNVPKE